MTIHRDPPTWFHPDTLESLPWAKDDDREAFERNGYYLTPGGYRIEGGLPDIRELDAFMAAHPPIDTSPED